MIIILDGNSITYRAYHKAPPLTAPDGRPTGTVHIFFTILEKVRSQLKPARVLAVFDSKGPTKRHEKYPAYKATRDAMPEALAVQLEIIQSILPLAGVAVYAQQGVEADDIIATLAEENADGQVVIVTKDKDLFQLISDKVRIYDDQSGALLGEEDARAKFGILPGQMRDYLALLGDKSDNIPGVSGIGEKTASKLISEYGSLENLYAHLPDLKGKLRENLERDREKAYFARELIALEHISPVHEPITGQNRDKLQEVLSSLGMRTVAARLLSESGGSVVSPKDIPVPQALALCRMGEVVSPAYFIAVDEECFVSDGKQYESFHPDRHVISDSAKFYDVKAFYKVTGEKYNKARDYLLISWLVEPDGGTIKKGRTEPMEEFIPRLIDLAGALDAKLTALDLDKLYTEVELPVAFILGKTENFGIKVDPRRVDDISRLLKQKIALVADDIKAEAAGEINLNSPKQLSEFLYDQLQIPQLTKTKRSTAEDVLKELMLSAPKHKKLLENILLYREYSKLLSTYTGPLVGAIRKDGRIHTTYKQTGAATGRLSSIAPNLQNIPVRGDIGKTIRSAFVPAEENIFVSFDYSQIELRVLAHLSKDPHLTEAFQMGEDIHSITAMKIFHLTPQEVTPETRRLAKAVNFGIIYGLSAFGLSRDARVTPREAKEFIEAYFALYSYVRRYISESIEQTREKGYCETILGRKRFFPEIHSRNALNRQKAERAAMNAPLQGSAADIIKLAMIRCDNMIAAKGFDAHLCLQIHDELVFELPKKQAEDFLIFARFEMENAVKLSVPLEVNTSAGESWGDLK